MIPRGQDLRKQGLVLVAYEPRYLPDRIVAVPLYLKAISSVSTARLRAAPVRQLVQGVSLARVSHALLFTSGRPPI